MKRNEWIRAHTGGSADFQSAVSPNCIRLGARPADRGRIANPRYSRLKICATMFAAQLLLGQVYDRQFKTAEAIAALENAGAKGEARPQFKVLLGTLYYKGGQDDKAAELLGAALDALTDLDQRSAVCRMLGNLYLR